MIGTHINCTSVERALKKEYDGGRFMPLPPPGGAWWQKMFKIRTLDFNIFSRHFPPGGGRDMKLPPLYSFFNALSRDV